MNSDASHSYACATFLISLHLFSGLQNMSASLLPELVYYLGSKWQPGAPASLFCFIGVVEDEMDPLALAIRAENIVLEHWDLNFCLWNGCKWIFPLTFITTRDCFFGKGAVEVDR